MNFSTVPAATEISGDCFKAYLVLVKNIKNKNIWMSKVWHQFYLTHRKVWQTQAYTALKDLVQNWNIAFHFNHKMVHKLMSDAWAHYPKQNLLLYFKLRRLFNCFGLLLHFSPEYAPVLPWCIAIADKGSSKAESCLLALLIVIWSCDLIAAVHIKCVIL